MSLPFTFHSRIRSFKYAFRGIATMLRTQHNAWIHLLASVVVGIAGLVFHLSRDEWCWIVLAITSVWAAEAMNTAFEFLCDATTREFHPLVGQAKDVAAGAVLLTAMGSIAVGLMVFLPKVKALLFP